MPNPTIVAASLDDKELQASINQMVANFDRGLQKMLDHSNEYVGKIQESLEKIGKTNFGATDSNNGGTSKQVEAQEELGKSVDKTTSKIKKQGEVSEMSFDQIAAGLDKARRTVSEFNTIRASGTLPSSEDYKRYEQALARIVEYNDKLKQLALSRADANQWANAFDAKRVVSDLTTVDERLKQLGKYYADLEKQSQKTASSVNKQLEDEAGRRNIVIEQMRAFYKEQERASKEAAKIQNKDFRDAYRGALSMPANNIDEVRAKIERLKALLDEMRDKKGKGLINISESDLNRVSNSIARLNQQIDKDAQKRLAAIEKESAAQKKLKDEQYKLMLARTNIIPTDQLDLAQTKLERLQALLREMRERGILSPKQIVSMETEIHRLEQMIGQVNTVQQQTTQSAQRYTDEIRKQAAAIRATKEWQEKGSVIIGEKNYYDPERANVTKRERAQLLSLEEQIVQVQQKQAQEALVAAEAKRQQAQAAKEVANVSRPTPLYDIPNVGYYQMYEDSKKILHGGTANTSGMQRSAQEAQYLREQIAGLLEVNEKEIKVANTASASYNQLAQYLKQLQSAYNRLGTDRVAKGEGTDLANEIQRVQRAMQKLQQTMSRPISLNDALNLPAKTLDDMAYKMRQLQSYKLGVNITDQKGLDRLKEVDQQIARLKKQYDDLMVKNMQVIQSNTALGRSWNYMKNRLAFYFTVGASTAFIRSLIDVRGQYELLERSIGILIDSAQNGSQIFAELNAMAIKSPFTTMELGAAAKQLVAYDVAAKDVVETTKRLADMAAAVGIPIERLTYALGQIKAYGYLNARDARMFANAGIPLVKELADRYTELEGRLVSTADVYDRIKKKAISYEDVMDTVNKMTDEGGKFFNFQEKAADTLKVKIANLTLAWNNMLNEMGKDNQSIIGGGLNATKQIFEHWRDINNMMLSVVSTIGLLKTAQTAYLLLTSKVVDKTRALTIMQTVLGQKIALNLAGLGASFMKFVSNPANLAAAAIAGLVAWLGKAAYDYYDLVKANEEFNKSIVTNAEENIKSIDKFFKDYYSQLSTVGSLNSADQTKLWERIQEEIEKTTKNAEEYVRVLEKIENISERIAAGEAVLEQSKRIQEELKRLAERETFDIGGGFADDTLAENLQETSKYANALIKQYGSLEEAEKKLGLSSYGNDWKDYKAAIAEAEGELESVTQKLDKVNIAEVLGSGDVETQLANVRAFAHAWRDAFLATEKGSKIGIEGQTLLNNKLDEWITKQAVANGLIKDREINNLRVDAQAIVNIEKNRTAWEEFFKYLNNEERKRLDVAIKTNQLESDSIQKIWDDVAKRMKESSTTSYNLIQEQIANLRETPAIFIDIIYREKREKLDAQQQAYEDKYITPQSPFILNPDKYLKEEKTNREKYGRFIKKQGEDNVEWEKRLGQEYQNNEKSIKSLTDQIAKSANMSDVDKKAKQGELDTLTAQQKVLKEIEKDQGFNYDQFKKGKKGSTSKKDILGDALAKEVQLIGEIQKRYKEYQQMGVNAQEAVTLATEEYGNTLRRTNATLAKYGIATKSSDELAGMDIREVRDYYKALLEGAKNKDNAKGIEAIEKALANINVEITKLDYKKITDGLNNELGKLKEEYELAVELDADPEMGNMFASYFGINTNELPRTFQDAAKKAQAQIDRVFKENGRKDKVDILSMLNKESFDKWVKDSGLKMDSELVKAVEQFRQYLHKVQGDEIKNTTKNYQALIEKYGGLQAQILKIYKDSVKEQGDIVRQFGDNAQIKQALDLIRQINISQDPAEIARLQEQLATVMRDVVNGNPIAMKTYEASQNEQKSKESKAQWEAFKNDDMYSMVFADMANNSIFSIELIIQKLNELKDKVKEDPTSMKELIRSLENAKEEFAARNPIQGIIDGVDRWTKASQRLKNAKNDLAFAIGAENNAKQQVKDAEQAKDTNKLAVATAVLASATANREKQEKRVAKASNDVQQSQEDTKKSIKGVADTMKSAQDTLSGVSAIFKAFGDDETAEAIDAINQGFSAMISVVMGVYTAMQMLNTAVPWLLAISAALAVIVGLVSFLSGHSDKKITEQVEESERAVKKLENRVESLKGTYDAMTDSAEHSYGAQSAAATLAASSIKEQEVALKRLMLSETKRQLRLEQSRDSKKRDDDKILSLQKDIISQQNEIDSMLRETSRAVEEVVDSLLGISRGSWAEELTDALISAFKAGEDYMSVFEDSWEEMVQNMVVKTISARVIGDALEKNVLSRIEQIEKEETDPYREAEANIAKYKAELQNKRLENENEWLAQVSQLPEFAQALETLGEDAKKAFSDPENSFRAMFGVRTPFLEKYGDQLEQALFKVYDNYVTGIEGDLNVAQQTAQERALREVLTGETGKATKQSLMDSISSVFPDFMETWGVKFGQDADKELSALQRGVQGVTEQTAGAIEGYMNGVSQQVYLQSNILQQINIAVQSFNFDAQLGTISQILLQLQTTYQNQQAIRSIMEGWTNASGMAVRVEMV